MRPDERHPVGDRLLRVATAVVIATSALSGLKMGTPVEAHAALVATAVPDNATVSHDRELRWEAPGVLANDLNLLGSTTAVLVSGVSNGALDLDPDGGFTYVPDAGFIGSDSFRYRPSGLLSTAAKVTITVTNAAPLANADSYTWQSGTSLVVPAPGVLSNDADADGDALVAELVGGGISGSFELDEDGSIHYTPGGGFPGSGSVSYRVWDGVAWSTPTTISLMMQSPTPTPRPTPRPTPTPLPSLPVPLPSLPLPTPSLPPLPLPGVRGPEPSPSPPISEPTSTARSRKTPRHDNRDPSAPERRSPSAGGLANSGAAPPPTSGTPSGLPPGPEQSGVGAIPEGPAFVPRIDAGTSGLEIRLAGIDVLAGIEVWAVPAATIGVSGLLAPAVGRAPGGGRDRLDPGGPPLARRGAGYALAQPIGVLASHSSRNLRTSARKKPTWAPSSTR